MKETMNKIKMFMPANRLQSNLAIAFSIFALFFAVGSSNVPCLSADTCAVGSDETFSGTLSIQNGTNYNLQVTGNPTANRVLTLPDATGTVALTSDIPSVPTLTASKIMATDGAGVYSTTNIYPLSLGTVGQVLTVNSLQTELEYSSITGVPTLTASKSVATDGTGALTTTDVYPLSLTASTPLKTNATGEVTASDLDITTDITAGTSLQQIRTNAGGTALEFFTPSGGGDYTLINSGAVQNPTGNADEFLVCWGSVLDATKTYKLVLWGGSGNLPNGQSSYNVYLRPGKDDCSTGTRTEWDSSANANYNALFNGRIHSSATSRNQDIDLCYILQGNDTNSSTQYSANVGGTFTLRQNGSVLSSNTDRGIRIGFDVMAQMYMHPSGLNGGIQRGSGFCNWDNDLLFSDITHFYGSLDVDSAGIQQLHDKYWALYETGSQ